MRISDWSSDVCSSDLPARRQRTGARRRPSDAAPRCLTRGQPAEYRRLAECACGRADRQPCRFRPACRGHAFRHGGLGGVRSEEHTSELQSLMRITYAVFCLKKTTKTYILCNNNNYKNKTSKNNNI